MGTKRYSATAARWKQGKDRYAKISAPILFKMKKTLRANDRL